MGSLAGKWSVGSLHLCCSGTRKAYSVCVCVCVLERPRDFHGFPGDLGETSTNQLLT